jgi:uncharacterized protein YqgC (DUF456 family)
VEDKMGSVLGLVLLWIFMLAGLAVIPFGIPGTFIIVLDALIYGLATGFEKISLIHVGILLALGVGVEVIEELFSGWMARRFGGSRWAYAGALIGGFLGAVGGTALMPVLGTLLGGFSGAAVGAFLIEGIRGVPVQTAIRVGAGAFLGAVSGKLTKIIVAVCMVIFVAMKVHGG